MRLHFEEIGTGFPIVIIHGLFGSSDNWMGVARQLSRNHRVILPDLRNHGKSPHSPEMSYRLMAADVVELMDTLNVAHAHVLGHSMGGKVAMQIALSSKDHARSLIVVDIAPKRYPALHAGILRSLSSLNLSTFQSRLEMENALAWTIPDLAVRRFLLKGVERGPNDRFQWRMGLREIADNYERLGEPITASTPSPVNALFFRGELSPYVSGADSPEILRLFPNAQFEKIPGAGHWLHVENAGVFMSALRRFLADFAC